MGECLSTNDPLKQISQSTITNDNINDNNNNDEKEDENNKQTNDSKSNCDNIYCNDWLKFPICCPYCSNHSEPISEFQLVILGPGYTGKTTLRHHLVQRYGHAFCKADFLMYRDILQHNVLDLFRDLLQKPTLSFTQLKQFITYIHKKSGNNIYILYLYVNIYL